MKKKISGKEKKRLAQEEIQRKRHERMIKKMNIIAAKLDITVTELKKLIS